MHIVGLEAENFKRLRAVRIKPGDGMVEVTGRNGQGKTSLLDAIWAAVGGAAAAPGAPIRKGEQKATIKLDLGNIKVTRTFEREEDGLVTTKLKVEGEDGFRGSQGVLTALINARAFDPLAFLNDDPAEQLETLKRFAPDYDFAGTEQAIKDAFASRRDINRDAKAARTRLVAVKVPEGADEALVDETALVAELEEAGRHNTDLGQRRERREAAAAQIVNATATAKRDRERAAELRREAEAMDKQAEGQEAHVAELQRRLEDAPPLPEPKDTVELRARINEARQRNERTRAAQQAKAEHDRLKAEAERLEVQSMALTEQMEHRRREMRSAIEQADLPVPGLELGDEEVMLDGVPFRDASRAQQIRVSVAIAAAANPRLMVAFVKDGALLDSDSWKLLAEYAEERGLQCWCETVQSNRPGAILIEDGSVVEPQPAAPVQQTLV